MGGWSRLVSRFFDESRSSLALGALGMLLVASCGGSSSEPGSGAPYQIGFIADLTGVAQSGGTSSQAGFMAAVARINSAGGIGGHKINVTTVDAQSSTSIASSGTVSIVSSQPTMIFDAVQSSEIAATAATLQSAAIPTVAIALSADLLGPPPAPWYFLITPNANQTATEVVNGGKTVAGGSLSGKRVGIVGYGTPAVANYVKAVKSQLADQGANVVVEITDPAGSLLTSWSSQAAKVADAKPDVMLMFPNPSNTPMEMAALATAGVSVPIVTSEGGSDEQSLAKVANPQLHVIRSSTPTPLLREWADKAGYGANSNGVYPGKGWIAGYLIAFALQKCSYPCTAKTIQANLESAAIPIPGDVALGPIMFTNSLHGGLTKASLFRWDPNKQAGVPVGQPFSIGPQ